MESKDKMRSFSALCVAALLLLSLSGCDFLRTVAGRPTSSELAVKREAVLAREAAEREAAARAQFVRDSVAAAEKHRADSAAAETFFKEGRVSRIRSASLPGLRTDGCPGRYCIVLAGFSQPQNATRFSATLKDAGYEPVVMGYNRGRNTLVGVNPTDDIAALRATYERVRQEKFCPRDAWIFTKE